MKEQIGLKKRKMLEGCIKRLLAFVIVAILIASASTFKVMANAEVIEIKEVKQIKEVETVKDVKKIKEVKIIGEVQKTEDVEENSKTSDKGLLLGTLSGMTTIIPIGVIISKKRQNRL